MKAQFQRQAKFVDKRGKPSSRDRARIARHRQSPNILRIQLEVISTYLYTGGRNQIGQRTRAECKEPLVGRQRGSPALVR